MSWPWPSRRDRLPPRLAAIPGSLSTATSSSRSRPASSRRNRAAQRCSSIPLGIRPDVVAVPMSEERILELTQFIHERYRRCGGFVWPTAAARRPIKRRRRPRAQRDGAAPAPPSRTRSTTGRWQCAAGRGAGDPHPQTITDLSAFFTRHHNCPTGKQSAHLIRDKWQALRRRAGRDVTVELFNHTAYTTPAALGHPHHPGHAPPSEFIVLGGHQDSIAGSNCATSRSPGADDDASGIATLSEIIRVAMQTGLPPAAHGGVHGLRGGGGRPAGLRPDRAAVRQPARQRGRRPAVRHDQLRGTPQRDIVIFTRLHEPRPERLLQPARRRLRPEPAVRAAPTSQCGYGCSDHASWNTAAIAASFPFEAPFDQHSPFIHTQNDTLAQSGGHAHRSVPFAQLGAVYMAELAKGIVGASPGAARAQRRSPGQPLGRSPWRPPSLLRAIRAAAAAERIAPP